MNTTQSTTQSTEESTEVSTDKARPAPTVWPTLLAHDAPALIDFLVGTVGFERTAVYEDDGKVAHAQLDWPDGGGVMLGSYDPEEKGGWTLEPGTFGAYVVTDHVDELYERLTAPGTGVRILREIADQPYGNREFAITDPEGNKWSFGPYRGEPRGGGR